MENKIIENNGCASVEALVKLGELNLGYIPWTASAMTPQSIVYILNEIIINQRRRILELGMGLSTLFIAKLMQEIPDIQLISVDHDQDWIEICRLQLKSKSLNTDRHTIIHAPLKKRKNAHTEIAEYYDINALSADQTFQPNLVIIDGPPAWREDISEARVPAYEILLPIIQDNTTVFVDDYQRTGESKLLDLFLADPSWTLSLKDPETNVAILRNGSAHYNIF
ncbi:MAG: class I SAM-dependent methyltransferase [Spirulina sp.]